VLLPQHTVPEARCGPTAGFDTDDALRDWLARTPCRKVAAYIPRLALWENHSPVQRMSVRSWCRALYIPCTTRGGHGAIRRSLEVAVRLSRDVPPGGFATEEELKDWMASVALADLLAWLPILPVCDDGRCRPMMSIESWGRALHASVDKVSRKEAVQRLEHRLREGVVVPGDAVRVTAGHQLHPF
jgi:hypothetical protein